MIKPVQTLERAHTRDACRPALSGHVSRFLARFLACSCVGVSSLMSGRESRSAAAAAAVAAGAEMPREPLSHPPTLEASPCLVAAGASLSVRQ